MLTRQYSSETNKKVATHLESTLKHLNLITNLVASRYVQSSSNTISSASLATYISRYIRGDESTYTGEVISCVPTDLLEGIKHVYEHTYHLQYLENFKSTTELMDALNYSQRCYAELLEQL